MDRYQTFSELVLGIATDIDQLIQAFRLRVFDPSNFRFWILDFLDYKPIRDLVKDCRHLIITPNGNLGVA